MAKTERTKTGKTPGGRAYFAHRGADGSKYTTVNPNGGKYKRGGDDIREHVKTTTPQGVVKKFSRSASGFGAPDKKIKKSFTTKRTPRNGDF